MGVYVLTVFEKDGSKALDDHSRRQLKKAKAKGESILQEKDCMKNTSLYIYCR